MNSYKDIRLYCKEREVTLVAVSKFQSIEKIKAIYDQGHRTFGENRVQEILLKKEQLPGDIQWHLIGHLQTNKVRQIIPHVDLIHSVDSLRLLKEIQKEAKKINRTTAVLLQIHIAQEETKYGLRSREAMDIAEYYSQSPQLFSHIRFCGLMGMASLVENEKQIRKEFSELRNLFHLLKDSYFLGNTDFREISMGMSGDYKIAIEEGSTLIRVGSLIFGNRPATNLS